MFDSKSKTVKIVSYVIMGFLTIVIIISFGMPDFVSRMGGGDANTVAMVNGEKVSLLDFLRYRDRRFREYKDKNMEDFILSNYISEMLILQNAAKLGFSVSEDRVMKVIRNIPDFKDQSTGKFHPERFKMILAQNHFSLNEFYQYINTNILKEDFFQYLGMGLASTASDIRNEAVIANSRLQIKYTYLSNVELRQRLKDKLAVTDEEVNADMTKNAKDVKDPKTDRERFRKNLETKKFDQVKKELVDEVNKIALAHGSFNEATALLRGKTATTATFKIGEKIKDLEKDPKELKDLSMLENSDIYRDSLLTLDRDRSSRVINTPMGLYIFTPVMKDIKTVEPKKEELDVLERKMENDKLNMMSYNLVMALQEKAKIKKFLKKTEQ